MMECGRREASLVECGRRAWYGGMRKEACYYLGGKEGIVSRAVGEGSSRISQSCVRDPLAVALCRYMCR